MRYTFFFESEHPKIFAAIASYSAGILAQRSVRNIRYFNGELKFLFLTAGSSKEISVLLDDERFDIEQYDLVERNVISFAIRSLARADEVDAQTVNANYATQFALTSAFRTLQAFLGGRRYVALCRDMIDMNMDKCLRPYMYEDLVSNMFVCFNKSIGKDLYGLLDSIKETLEELHFDEEELRRIYSVVGNKGSFDGYHHFALSVLASEKLGPAMRHMIVDAYVPLRFNGKETSPYLSSDLFPFFSDEELCTLLMNLPRGMKETVREIFQFLGPDADAKFASAYSKNVNKDPEILMSAPCFPNLPTEVKATLVRGKVFTPKASNLEVIHYYETLQNEDEKDQILRFCEDFGRDELKKALLGKDFIPNQFSLADLVALSSHVNYGSAVMAPRIKSYVSRYISLEMPSNDLDQILLALDGAEFLPLMQTAIFRDCFSSPVARLIIAERYGLLSRLGLKEWKYHD